MFPSAEKKYAGIFVKNQIEEMIQQMGSDHIDYYCLKRKFTNGIGSVLKYLRFFIGFTPYLFKKYDSIIVHYFLPTFILAFVYKIFHRSNAIVIFHGSDINEKVNSKVSVLISRFLLSQSNYVIAVGKDLKSNIETKLKKNVDEILCAGIDSRVFYPKNINKVYDFVFVGSLVERKGIKILIETIKILNVKRKFSFCIVGSGPYENMVSNLTKIANVDYQQNLDPHQLSEVYNQSKWLVFPSMNEPFGLVVSEAFFCGTPAIGFNSGGLKDQIAVNQNGYLLDDFSPSYLANHLIKVSEMPDAEYLIFVENAKNSNKQYDLRFVCERLIEVSKEG